MKTIVIDPGHGGPGDPGAVFGNRIEKDDNLRLGLAVAQRLRAAGQNVIMTRNTDVSVPLAERAAISNRNNADLFISLHRNSSGVNPNARGVENFVYPFASPRSFTYAQNVLDRVVAAGVAMNRGLKTENFAVLRLTNAPAQLLELNFISNDEDNRLFDRNFEAYADAIAKGILESLGEPAVIPPTPPPPTTATKKSLTAALQATLNILFGAGLVVDGIFGPLTQSAIRLVRRGDRNEMVRILQEALTLNGVPTTADGIFGPATEANLRAFQAYRGLVADGIAGPLTFRALLT